MGGDFNCTVNEILDRNHAEPHPVSQHALRQLVSSHGLVDVWRRMHTSCRQYTWSHVRENRISLARLDSLYVFKHRICVIKMCKILPVGFTDHSLVLCNVFIRNIWPKSTYWHFNSVLTVDKSFKEALSYFWNDFRQKKKSLSVWGSGGTMERFKLNFYVSSTLCMSHATSPDLSSGDWYCGSRVCKWVHRKSRIYWNPQD